MLFYYIQHISNLGYVMIEGSGGRRAGSCLEALGFGAESFWGEGLRRLLRAFACQELPSSLLSRRLYPFIKVVVPLFAIPVIGVKYLGQEYLATVFLN